MSKVGIIMGSKSDYPVMKEAENILKDFGIDYEIDIVSAHRTPEKMMEYSKNAHKNGISVIIAGAGGAAHLPGMVASNTPLPVIGVPVATVALDGAKNAGILAAEILGSSNPEILQKIIDYKKQLENNVKSSSLDD